MLDASQIGYVAPECVARLNGAMQFSLEALNVVNWIVLVGVRQSGQGCRSKTVFMSANAACHNVGNICVHDQGSDRPCKRALIVVQLVGFVLCLKEDLEVGVLGEQVSLQVEIPPTILRDGVGELEVLRDGLQLDLPWDMALVTTISTVAVAVATRACSCPAIRWRCPDGLRALRGVF